MAARELPVPADAAVNGAEVLRAFIVNGGLTVSMERAFEKPDLWGMLLADIARHAARIFAHQTNIPEAEALERICDMFDQEMAKPTDIGTTEVNREN